MMRRVSRAAGGVAFEMIGDDDEPYEADQFHSAKFNKNHRS